MSEVNIITSAKSKAVIGTVSLDVSLNEEHSHKASVTKNPVESGAVVSDHVFSEPFALSMTGEISDSPVKLLSGIRELVEGRNPGGIIGEIFYGSDKTRSNAAYRALVNLKEWREPITIMTGLARYPNMIITGVKVNRSAQIGKTLNVTITAEQVRIVGTLTATVPASAAKATKKADKGKQPSKPATDAQATEYRSTLHSGLGALVQ